jgi:hypothetical protein
MSTWWDTAQSNCKYCSVKIAELKIEKGKINILSRSSHWGTLRKVPGTSKMEAICRKCQKTSTS